MNRGFTLIELLIFVFSVSY
ncbi:TPA: prepilin-type N-terminal cleavage/methylation domain-containing protein [Vibrio vulnificus]